MGRGVVWMKKAWWLIPVALLLTAAIIIFSCWDAIAIRVTPKVVLSKALINTFSGFRNRMEDSPLSVLANGIDGSGQNTIDMILDTENIILGDIQYQMVVQTEGNPRRIHAQGTVASNDGSLDLEIYLDKDFAAVSSKSLLEGKFYGITYDTFPEDIRGIPLLPFLIGEKTVTNWEKSVAEWQSQMEKSYEMPRFSTEDLQMALGGIMALKAQVMADTLTINGQKRDVYRVSFSATGPEIASAAHNYSDNLSDELQILVQKLGNDPDSEIQASFYVYEDVVVKISCDTTVQNETIRAELFLGMDAARDDLNLSIIQQTKDSLEKWSVDVQTEYDTAHYGENLSIVHIENGVQDRTAIDYVWDLSSGNMRLNLTEGQEPVSVLLNLQSTETGFRISTDQFEALMSAFGDEKKTGSSSCVMTVTKGSNFSTPKYKNVDQWSGEDLLTLLGGIGALFGLNIQ